MLKEYALLIGATIFSSHPGDNKIDPSTSIDENQIKIPIMIKYKPTGNKYTILPGKWKKITKNSI